jgi:hypothetical protein
MMNTPVIDSAYKFVDNKIIIRLRDRVCESADELITSSLFREVVERFVRELARRDSVQTAQVIAKMQLVWAAKLLDDQRFIQHPAQLYAFVEGLYDYWRKFERFLVCNSAGDVLDKRPYRTFNSTVGSLTNLVRGTYRDILENLSGQHPRIYRQVSAGAEVAAIALPKELPGLGKYAARLEAVPVIRQVLLYPPMLLNPPMNKRTGSFERVDVNPLDLVAVDGSEWLCYPARVGKLLVMAYFHEKFFELGFTMSNLFELADDATLQQKPDAIFLYGVPENSLDHLAELPTVFYDDGDILVGAVPRRAEFGYFGYLKKMILTLHNIKVMQAGNMPFHGAMVSLQLKGGKSANILLFGDTGAGKSETLEAFRSLAGAQIREMTIVADDMGSLDFAPDGRIIAYGTEIGAFVRLDDLQPGYALSQLDRSIIMNPSQTNARVVLPVTSYENVIKGFPVDIVLYANNYQDVDDEHPVVAPLLMPAAALEVFRDGAAMSKGTTTSTGLVHTYFVNVFGPLQYHELHEEIARRFFEGLFEQKTLVAQLRTRLGLPGWERSGPEVAARALLELLEKR